MPRKDFFSKFASKLDAMDPASISSYIHLLAREHGFLESVFNSIKEGIVVIDSSFRLVYHNAVAKEMFGIPDRFDHIRISHLVKGISWNDLVSPDRENPSSAYHEVEILYPRRRILKFYVAPRPDSDPEQRYATLIFNDITDMYDRMHSAAESERTQLVSMLAAEVAHDRGVPGRGQFEVQPRRGGVSHDIDWSHLPVGAGRKRAVDMKVVQITHYFIALTASYTARSVTTMFSPLSLTLALSVSSGSTPSQSTVSEMSASVWTAATF